MDFVVEFYETEAGACHVWGFLDELKASDIDATRERMRDWQRRAEQ